MKESSSVLCLLLGRRSGSGSGSYLGDVGENGTEDDIGEGEEFDIMSSDFLQVEVFVGFVFSTRSKDNAEVASTVH